MLTYRRFLLAYLIAFPFVVIYLVYLAGDDLAGVKPVLWVATAAIFFIGVGLAIWGIRLK